MEAGLRAERRAPSVPAPLTRTTVRASNDLGVTTGRRVDPRSRRSSHVDVPVLRWRLIRDEPRTGARNMAIDHALAECLEPHEGVLRLYRWSRPTLSLGRNEPAAIYPLVPLVAMQGVVDLVRRPTGGRAVLHDAELTYAIAAPLRGWGARAAYRAINEALAAALRSLGAPVGLADDRLPALPPDAGPCFASPAAGEVVAWGAKLVGSAQARIGGALLQHGSILLSGTQRLLAGADRPEATSGGITLTELLPHVSIDEVAAAVAESLRMRLGGEWGEDSLRPAEDEAALRLEADRYGRDTWTWRR